MAADARVVTYATRGMEPHRGFPQFMAALPAILRADPKAVAVIAGENRVAYGGDALRRVDWKARALAENDIDPARVHFVGRLGTQDYLTLLQRSSAACLPDSSLRSVLVDAGSHERGLSQRPLGHLSRARVRRRGIGSDGRPRRSADDLDGRARGDVAPCYRPPTDARPRSSAAVLVRGERIRAKDGVVQRPRRGAFANFQAFDLASKLHISAEGCRTLRRLAELRSCCREPEIERCHPSPIEWSARFQRAARSLAAIRRVRWSSWPRAPRAKRTPSPRQLASRPQSSAMARASRAVFCLNFDCQNPSRASGVVV